MCLTGTDHKIIRFFLLDDPPHALDVLRGKSPVPLCVKISQVEIFLLSCKNPGNCPGDLAGDKRLAPAGRLVVEEDSIRRKEIVPLPVITGHPVGIDLCAGIGAAWVEG